MILSKSPTRRMTLATVLAIILALCCTLAAPQLTRAEEVNVGDAPPTLQELKDGNYSIEVKLEGGTGRASIESPTRLEVYEGRAFVTITWSSPNYDYMKVKGQKYLPTNTEGNSSFEIVLDSIDKPLKVKADTTAMSKPHEISYKLIFDPSSIRREKGLTGQLLPIASVVGLIAMIAVIIFWSRRHAQRISGEE